MLTIYSFKKVREPIDLEKQLEADTPTGEPVKP